MDYYLVKFQNQFENEFFSHRIKPSSKKPFIYHIYKEVYRVEEKDHDIMTFEGYLISQFRPLIQNAVEVVTLGLNSCIGSPSKRLNYKESILLECKDLTDRNSSLEFQNLSKQLDALVSHVKRIFHGQNGIVKAPNSSFDLKENYGFQDLELLAQIAEEVGFISDDHSNAVFVNTLAYSGNDNKIRFNCTTPYAVLFLKEISFAFENLNAKSIEQSQKIFTKQGRLLNVSNYESAKSRIKWNSRLHLRLIDKIDLHYPDR